MYNRDTHIQVMEVNGLIDAYNNSDVYINKYCFNNNKHRNNKDMKNLFNMFSDYTFVDEYNLKDIPVNILFDYTLERADVKSVNNYYMIYNKKVLHNWFMKHLKFNSVTINLYNRIMSLMENNNIIIYIGF